MDVDLEVRAAIYRHFADHAAAPAPADVARAVHAAEGEVREAYARLGRTRMLVLMPDGESIRMAPPFSGIETQHRVRANGREYFANCPWDAFGIPAALHAEADVISRCEGTLEPLHLHLGPGGPPPSTWLFHAAVPAAHWWRDIVYT
jgi:hypothetical protein